MDSGRLEAVPPGTVNLDTVRALHQTVVSLRTALEISKNELKELKEKYEQHSHCLEYTDVIEKLTLENHILRRKIIDSGYTDKEATQNIKFQVTYSPRSEHVDDNPNSEILIKTATTDANTVDTVVVPDTSPVELSGSVQFCSTEKLDEIVEEPSISESNLSDISHCAPNGTSSPHPDVIDSQISISKDQEENQPSFKTKLELLSKFDVRIKVRTLKEGTIVSSTTSDSDSTFDEKKERVFEKPATDSQASFHFEEKREHFQNLTNPDGDTVDLKTASTENIKMAVPNEAEVKSKADKFNVQVRITSEENLIVKETNERSRRKDTLNLDVDDLSLRSMSEGDNSVFSEGGTTPMEAGGAPDDKLDPENGSGNESEEVDDIELIFTTDESKDMSNLQEDLVSIRETDNWAPASASTTHSTPVLIKFHTLDPDFQPGGENVDNAENENQENTSLQGVIAESTLKTKRVSLPSEKEIRHVAFNGKGGLDLPGRGILKSCDNKSDNTLYKKSPNTSTRKLDSVDSLTCEYNRGLSFDNTKSSSFELGSSMDILHRDESVDSFHRNSRLGHRFSVFAATDISKCGISEDDLASNLNVRRNTCPNPFQYKPPMSRGASRSSYKSTIGRSRPVIRDCYAPRRESGAQTDVSALPPRWTSDGYLAYKMWSPSVVCPPTLPTRVAPKRVPPPETRPPPPSRRTDEARRVLLSDLGFTSMVPELSRSAEPLWTLRRGPPPPESPQPKYFSRGSSYRSPCMSVDRSNDWIPSTYGPSSRGPPCECRGWRGSLPDVRADDTDELLRDADIFLRRSIDNLRCPSLDACEDGGSVGGGGGGGSGGGGGGGRPYVPAEARQLRLGHAVKLITPHGRLAVGRVRYVGLAGGTAANSGVVVGAEFSMQQYPGLPRNDGTHRGRRYFLAPPNYTALFVPFSKVVMAWSN